MMILHTPLAVEKTLVSKIVELLMIVVPVVIVVL